MDPQWAPAIAQLQSRFYDIRADFLNEDEIDYELNVRGIVCEEGAQMIRKRGNLREALKNEKERNALAEIKYELDPVIDLHLCREKTRLLASV